MNAHFHHAGCGCLQALNAGVARRGLFGLALGAAVTAAAAPAFAVEDQGYEAMLMKCIDPRFTTNTWAYMAARGWQNAYSQFNIGPPWRRSSRNGVPPGKPISTSPCSSTT